MKTTNLPSSKTNSFVQFKTTDFTLKAVYNLGLTQSPFYLPIFDGFRQSIHQSFLKISVLAVAQIFLYVSLVEAQPLPAPCPPTPNANSIDISDLFGTGLNTSSKLLTYRTSTTFLNASLPIANNWWRTDIAPTWFSNAYGLDTSNNQFTAQNYPNPNPLREVRITGEFIVDKSISMQYTEIKMGPNAKITIKAGALLDLKTCWIHSCDETSPMWQGITVESGGYLRTSSFGRIEDAIYAVHGLTGSFIEIANMSYNRNYISVFLDGPVVNGTANNGSGSGVVIQASTFSCVDKAMLQSGTVNLNGPYLPVFLKAPYANERSNLGVFVKNVAQSNMPHIGRTATVIEKNQFVHLACGIKVTNAYAQVLNAHFSDIHADPGVANSTGIAIDVQGRYSSTSPNLTQYKTQIGDTDPSTLYDPCTFYDVTTGVKVSGASDISIFHSSFDDLLTNPVILDKIRGGRILVKNNTIHSFTAKGLSILNCVNNLQLEVHQNVFNLNANTAYSALGKFSETGIYMVNTPIGFSGAFISENTFNNVRFGVYGNGLRSATVTTNVIDYNRPWSVMQNNLHAGIWLDLVDNVRVHFNRVEYNAAKAGSVPPGSSIAQNLRGLVLKAATNCNVATNIFRNTGRPIRCVDNQLNTYFNCNDFDGNFDAWQFQNVDLSVQGGPSKPTGNIWRNYPRTNSTAINKVAGSLNAAQDYYYSSVASGVSTQIPLPNFCLNFFPLSTSGTSPCQDQQLEDGWEEILDFVLSDTVNTNNDSILSEERRRWTAYMTASDSLRALPDFQTWYQQMEGSESRVYAHLVDSAYDRFLIIEELQELSGFRTPDYLHKRDLYLQALKMQLSEEDEGEPYDTLSLISIANTPAWSGTNAVFLSRGILSEEVDDEDLALRISPPSRKEVNCQIQVSIENTGLKVLSDEEVTIELFSADGRLIHRESLNGNNFISLSPFNAVGFYKVYSETCATTGKWMLVR